MEAADSGARQSGLTSASSDNHQRPLPYQPFRDPEERQPQHHEHLSAMATASVLHPAASYPQPPSYSSSYSQPPASSNISSTESRKNDDMDPLKRQSLPSISEVISGAKSYPPPPSSTTQQPNTSFPSPFTAGASRSFTESEKQPSPRSMRASSAAYPGRHEPTSHPESPGLSTYAGRSGRPPAPERRPSPIGRHEIPPPHHLPDPHKDSRPMNGGYPQPPPPASSSSSAPYPGSQLPPGQLPLPQSQYSTSPRYPPQQQQQAQPPQPNAYAPQHDRRFQPTIQEERDMARFQEEYRFDTASYQDALGRMASSSRILYNFADAYSNIAMEQHGAYHFPERLPSDMELNDMIAHAEAVRHNLEYMRNVVERNERAERMWHYREPMMRKDHYAEEDDGLGMYTDAVKSSYTLGEVKKRRGRAAPPGRCHSCNRVDTPEWRRGPDGARTLCNACGLHYAKLERKRQIEARTIRPKGDEVRK